MKYPSLTIHTDGGARGNPGPAGIGVIAYVNKDVVFKLSKYIGEATNNTAEYSAVIQALQYLHSQQISTPKVSFILDSELIVKQLTGQYKIKQDHLQKLALKIHHLLSQLHPTIPLFSFSHVKRHLNKAADALVNQAIDNHT